MFPAGYPFIAATVLIWGTTWIAMALQIGAVPVMVLIVSRFALAGAIMVLAPAVMGRLPRPTVWRLVVLKAHCFFAQFRGPLHCHCTYLFGPRFGHLLPRVRVQRGERACCLATHSKGASLWWPFRGLRAGPAVLA